MLQIADYLRPYASTIQSIIADHEFIVAHGIPTEIFAVADARSPLAQNSSFLYRIIYSPQRIDDIGNCQFMAKNHHGAFSAIVDRSFAMSTIGLMAVDPEFKSMVETLAPEDIRQSLQHFGLEPSRYLKPDVGSWEGGTWVAPVGDGFTVFSVEHLNGSVSLQAHGDARAAAMVLAANARMDRLRLPSRIAEWRRTGLKQQ